MPLPEPRPGESFDFHLHRYKAREWTLGNPENITWSSIKHLCIGDVAEDVLHREHNITSKRLLRAVSRNIRLYVNQAFELYEAARYARANTAPLFYYYAYLNLAKAVCEITHPDFYEAPECYRHGISWKPSTGYLVDMETECVTLTTRGVWHVLWESIACRPCKAKNPQTVRLKDLFALCPEIGTEFWRTYEEETRIIDLVDAEFRIDPENREVWIKFSVDKEDLTTLRISRPKLLSLITGPAGKYRQVMSNDEDTWTFELESPKRIPPRYGGPLVDLLRPEILALNLFPHLLLHQVEYGIPIQTRLPIVLPEITVLYSVIFWLGALVRYDPHSVDYLQDSEYWILLDGFMNQSRIWLLELFEWHFYQQETSLATAR